MNPLLYVSENPIAGDRGSMAVKNPFTLATVGEVQKASTEQVVLALQTAYLYKPTLSRFERSEILRKAAAIIDQRKPSLAVLISSESGLSLQDTMYEVGRVRDVLTFGANAVLVDDGQIFSCDITPHGKPRRVFTQRDPLLGVIVAITPFNHPMNQVAHKIVPSIVSNNRMVLKPSEKVPLSAYALADILYESGLPRPMFQVLTGDPADIANTLLTHPTVDLVTFTGGVAIGKYIASTVGYRRVVLELGGNDPIIVMDDADIEEAATLAANGSYKNSGQRCTAVKRILVHSNIKDSFTECLVEKTRQWSYGDPMDLNNQMGTVISENAAKGFQVKVDEAIAQGAKLLTGHHRDGAVYSPTVIDGVTSTMSVVTEETFGPISPIITFNTLDEAIQIVNGTAYGLSSSVCTNRLDVITRLVKELHVGSLNVREVPGYRLELTPFGGIKDSGLGYKEGIQEAIKSFTNLKTYSMPWPTA